MEPQGSRAHSVTVQISEAIRRARRDKDLTQEELGDLVGVHLKTVGKWERGVAVPRGKLKELEQHLGIQLVNRPSSITRVRVADPTTLSNAELTSAIVSYTSVLQARADQAEMAEPIDADAAERQGWSVTRLSDLQSAEDRSTEL